MWFIAGTGTACAAAFSILIILVVVRSASSRAGALVLLASGLTAAWALLTGFDGLGMPGLAHVAETARNLAWLAFLATLLAPHAAGVEARKRGWATALAVGIAIILLVNDLARVASTGRLDDLTLSQIAGREGFAIAGLLLVENLYRNTSLDRRWNVTPLCIAIGGLFAYELFLYSDALLFHHVNPLFLKARPAVTILVVPLLALTAVRNRDWRIDIHVSRQAVLHTLTLVASGVFLIAVAVAGTLLRELGGEWGALLQITSLFGSLLVLATVLSSSTMRARLKHVIARNFFSLRYDYRVEWMNFIDILSARGDSEDLQRRVIRAVANIVDSPAGALWTAQEGAGYAPAAFWNMRLPGGVVEPFGSAFVTGFNGGTWIQSLDASVGEVPGHWRCEADLWLAVPLVHDDSMIGFITLAPPRAAVELNWEGFDLLRAVGRQAASYLSEARTARELHDARRLQEYSKRFAFVVHDIKNLASQLSMIVANAQRHGDDPEFRADMFRTIDNSVARMNKLLAQLRANNSADEARPAADPRAIIAEVVRDCARATVAVRTACESGEAAALIEPEHLRSSLTHLVTNAIDASEADGMVTVRSICADGKLVIDVCDQGAGMDPDFVRDQLFKPFRSTKSGGYGIGAYQTRELIRSAGGELEVISAPGAGTTMRVILPRAEGAAPSAAA